MRRWRTVALLDTPTDDGRTIVSPLRTRNLEIPVRVLGDRPHEGPRAIYQAPWRVVDGGRVQVRLRWRERGATMGFDVRPGNIVTLLGDDNQFEMTMVDAAPREVTVTNRNSWSELR